MARLSLASIARAVHGEVVLGTRPPRAGAEHEVDGYSIDSRTVKPGELFFAIVGPRFDGHEFVKAAVERGAVAAVVAKGTAATHPDAPALVRVKDTTRALQDLGAHVRRLRPLRVVGITGSAGKTTAKEMTAAVLGQRFKVLKSEGNLNNTYGLPLVLLGLQEDHEVAVLEMGMSYHGEITRLVEIADPDAGAILNVLRVHLEHFGSLEKIAEAKGELFEGMRRDATAVFNADDRLVARLGAAFKGPKIPYGLVAKKARVRAEAIEVEGLAGSHFILKTDDGSVPVRLALPGRHNVFNALAAASLGLAMGLQCESIRRGLEAVRPASMRGVLHRLASGAEILDDSYNSNPAAMERAIESLQAASPRGRRVLVSGDMLELGSYEVQAHARLGRQVAEAGIDLFVAVGPLSRRAADSARAAGARDVKHVPDSEAAADLVASAVQPGDLILVKGSRGMRMERVVQALLKRDAQAAKERADRPGGSA
ncbi:MAG TPA: UDP-N-acetylmuramoyl-tripeptide--D-alanyl-D-alanine ligase [Candidatus Polarisedimenticolia bacterium]|nr:UDP-N-acetylmuramoyl-tripeptide--D-alanyl-D-alanine ligase [Candidatus Polarisedimenticolia bacterium]